jgi:hypothetical protein
VTGDPEIFVPLRTPTARAAWTLVIGAFGPLILIGVVQSVANSRAQATLLMVPLAAQSLAYLSIFLSQISARVELTDRHFLYATMFRAGRLPIAEIESVLPMAYRGDLYGMRVCTGQKSVALRIGSFSKAQMDQIRDAIVLRARALSSTVRIEQGSFREKTFTAATGIVFLLLFVVASGFIVYLIWFARHGVGYH